MNTTPIGGLPNQPKFTDYLYRLYWAVERRLVPGLRYSQFQYEEALDRLVEDGCKWLDLGCGSALLPPWRASQEKAILRRPGLAVGVDADPDGLRRHISLRHLVCGNGSHLPVPNDSFDLVTANMVVEHLVDPAAQFREVARVLRSRGVFLFHTPNLHSYATVLARAAPESVKSIAVRILEGRREQDRFRTFYRANSISQISKFARAAGLTVVEANPICTGAIFALFLPLAIPELLWIRALRSQRMRHYRPNLIVLLAKP